MQELGRLQVSSWLYKQHSVIDCNRCSSGIHKPNSLGFTGVWKVCSYSTWFKDISDEDATLF